MRRNEGTSPAWCPSASQCGHFFRGTRSDISPVFLISVRPFFSFLTYFSLPYSNEVNFSCRVTHVITYWTFSQCNNLHFLSFLACVTAKCLFLCLFSLKGKSNCQSITFLYLNKFYFLCCLRLVYIDFFKCLFAFFFRTIIYSNKVCLFVCV